MTIAVDLGRKATKQTNKTHSLRLRLTAGLLLIVRNRKIILLFLNQSICCGYSKEPSQRDGSFEHTKHMLKNVDNFTLIFVLFYLNLNTSVAFKRIMRCFTVFYYHSSSQGFGAQLIGPIQLHVKRQNSSICKFFQDIAWTFFCL